MSAVGRVRQWLILSALLWAAEGAAANGDYFPGRHDWQRRTPEAVGMDAEKLQVAMHYAQDHAVTEPSDLATVLQDSFSREPDYRLLGPTRARAGSSGVVLRQGYIVAEWGDIHRVDMTFSVTKSYLATVAGLALDAGLIADVHDRVGDYLRDGSFDSEHNRAISWHHLLQQTSDWQGTLWGVHDWADRPEGDDPEQWPNRQLHAPGSYFKYNDVRVNLLAYALLNVFRQPLPAVLRERVMDPIGASSTWRWHGYDSSWVLVDGVRMQSVSGGGHFGGGLFISTADHARFGLLFLRRGQWQGQRIISEAWIDAMRVPGTARRDYGYLWWLNTDRERLPAAPESSYWAAGFGGNAIWIDEEHELVVVVRWVPELAGVVERVLDAVEQ